MKKIDLMHKHFGEYPDICKNCSNLTRDGVWSKCRVYGVSGSEATDWSLSWKACGMFDKEPKNLTPIYKLPRQRKSDEPEVLPGQVSLFGERE